jgi:hypothetical protein
MTTGRPRIGRVVLWTAGALLALAPAGRARAGEAYYLLVFASQRVPNNPNYSHTFATFVRTSWPGEAVCPPAGGVCLEARTISWLPATGQVKTRALRPECGRNFGLDETMRLVLGTEQRVSLWGPYQIDPDLYARAVKRIAELEGGGVLYQANDMGRRSDHVSNCIHAVSYLADGRRLRVGSPGWGQSASFAALRRMRPWVLDEEHTHDWVALALGLNAYPIVYRAWERPFSGAIVGPAFRLLGGERNLEATYGPPPYRSR